MKKILLWVIVGISSLVILQIAMGIIVGGNAYIETSELYLQPIATDIAPTVRVSALKGPTGLGFAELMERNSLNETELSYEFSLVGSPDETVAKISSGEVDIAAVPTNLAATLYSRTNGKIKIAAVNTLGVLYILENGNEIQSIQDLAGKTIYATGQAAVPEYVLNYILEKNGILDSVTIEYKAEHSELATLLASEQSAIQIAMLPEPFVTTVLMGSEARIALDLTKEWEEARLANDLQNSVLSMGSIIVRTEFLEENPNIVKTFLDEYKASIEYVNANVSEASLFVEKFEIMPKAQVAQQAIPNCNIVFIEGDEMQAVLSNMFNVLFEANPQSIGGTLPDEKFYYKR